MNEIDNIVKQVGREVEVEATDTIYLSEGRSIELEKPVPVEILEQYMPMLQDDQVPYEEVWKKYKEKSLAFLQTLINWGNEKITLSVVGAYAFSVLPVGKLSRTFTLSRLIEIVKEEE